MEIFIGLVIVWLLFGIACAVIAANKGRSGGGWFVLGFLFGPFALTAALVISKDRETMEKESIQSGEMKRCLYCAELIKTAAIKCRYCGEDLPENQPPDLSDTPVEGVANIQQTVPSQWDSKEEARNNDIIVIIVIGIVLLVVLVPIGLSQC